MRIIVLGILSIILSGCVTITPPVSMGGERYLVTLNARGGFSSNGSLLTRTIQQADIYCAEKDKKANVLSTQSTGVQMWTPQDNQVIFECVKGK